MSDARSVPHDQPAAGVHPHTRVLLTILDNQSVRTVAGLEGLDPANLDFAPGGDCLGIRGIIGHLLDLRGFQLFLLGSPAAIAPKPGPAATLDELREALAAAEQVVRRALEAHDPLDWYAVPPEPRPGPWASDPTIVRFTRPLNDFTNHLGAIRAIRRMHGNPAGRTQ